MDNAKRTSGCSSVKISSGLPSTEEDQSTIEIILYDGLEEETFSGDDEGYMVVLEEVEEASSPAQVPYHRPAKFYEAVPGRTALDPTYHASAADVSRANASSRVTSASLASCNLAPIANAVRKGQWSHQWKICEENVPTRSTSKFRSGLTLTSRQAKVVRVTTGTPRAYVKESSPAVAQDKGKSTKVKRFKCLECGSSFSNKNYFREHLKKHGDELLWCSTCSKEMCSKETLESHMRLHRNERPFACGECSATFPGEKNLREHVKRLHSGRTFKCSVCSKELATADSLKAHESLHKAEKPFRCRQCDASYRNNKRLLEHTKRQHGEVHKCSICSKILATKVTLEAHERLHRNEKQFACDQCGKAFADKNYLREHLKRHKGRTFPCGQCDKQLATKSSLRAHEKLHDNIRPFGCDVCWATFAEKGQLKVHMRKHTGEKPFKCNMCSYAASQKHSVGRHMLVKHGEGNGRSSHQRGEERPENASEDLAVNNGVINDIVNNVVR
ncbi:zinc finger protein OZF-like isoform X2 [Varroa destructor]|uniref:C2H2-type domain-containing protein n=1 Tax=Varroa destructor TaxID=109461 RepID=A0A7M7J0Y6_VARDE|nr:zinc finger protein OZF-like isoform X2 [Varroa destructor]